MTVRRRLVGDWAAQGACLNADIDMYPEDIHGVVKAKAVCAHCPVTHECLHHAIDNHEHEGVWGGTSARERRAMRRSGLDPKAMAS